MLVGVSTLLVGCAPSSAVQPPSGGGSARLTARPAAPTSTITPGTWPLTVGVPNDGSLIVPASYDATKPTPLVVAFAGAGGTPSSSIALLGAYAAARGFLLLTVGARGLTWDVISFKYSYDVTFIDSALKSTYQRCNVDTTRTALVGFSDGATYALGLGLDNGDIFPRIVAFSPGYVPASDSPNVGHPEFFISHGKQDPVLNIDGASRTIVPALQRQGYVVTYVEFDGVHEVPSAISSQAMTWLLR